MKKTHSRRSFLSLSMAGLGLALVPNKVFAGSVHPEPREGIDASEVLTGEQVAKYGKPTQEVFDMIREIPQIADGIGCYCGCHTREGYRSLLTCFYEGGRGVACPICQGEAKLAYRRFKEGQELDKIRRAIDARFG
jgi:hypothetical protein